MEVEFYNLTADVQQKIKDCEGKHIQQVAYSSYHDALTQICFGCEKIRTSLSPSDANQKDSEVKSC